MTASPPPPYGVYVHVPFCASRCDYCAFATWTDRSALMPRYAAACAAEAAAAGLRPATSVFVGGGTPSLLDPDLLATVLDAVPRAAGCEVTAECNPDDARPELLEAWRRAGVTRVSLGVQSTDRRVLAALGRRHDPAAVARSVEAVRTAGFATFNLDLIYGAAGERDDDWRRTIDDVLSLDPPHLSAYALTVEPGTPLAADPDRHPDDDVQARRYLAADAAFEDAGLRSYEISSWARPGHECRHNQLYWQQGDYRGIGCAAHSHASGRRWWNVRTPERYIAAVEAGRDPAGGEELLDEVARGEEAFVLALRTAAGAPAGPLDQAGADRAAGRPGLVAVRDGRLVLTSEGRLLHSDLAARLLAVA